MTRCPDSFPELYADIYYRLDGIVSRCALVVQHHWDTECTVDPPGFCIGNLGDDLKTMSRENLIDLTTAAIAQLARIKP